MRRAHYTQADRERFFKALDVYREALRIGNASDIIFASLWIHTAKADVSRDLQRLVSKTYRETIREKAL